MQHSTIIWLSSSSIAKAIIYKQKQKQHLRYHSYTSTDVMQGLMLKGT